VHEARKLLGVAVVCLGVVASRTSDAQVYLAEPNNGSVVDVAAGGDLSGAPRFATGLSGPLGLCVGPGGDIYVSEFFTGEVTIITAGGDFSGAAPFATGLSNPVDLACTTTQVLVVEDFVNEVTDITAGGDFSGAAPFARGSNGCCLGGADWVNGRLMVSFLGEGIYDFTAGGDFTGQPAYASGVSWGLGHRGAQMLTTNGGSLRGLPGNVIDYTAGGDLSAV
jgi:hypothetical protein